MLPTTLMIRLSEFIYETLILKLLLTTNSSKKLLIIGEGFCPSYMHGFALKLFLLSLISIGNYKGSVFKK